MAYKYFVHHDYRLVYKKVWGRYTSEDSVAAHIYWDELGQQDGIGKYDELRDLSEVTEYGVSIKQIRNLAEHYQLLHKLEEEAGVLTPKKVAYVIPSPVAYGSGRVYEALIDGSGINFRVCRSIAEACDWLGLSDEVRRAVLPARDLDD